LFSPERWFVKDIIISAKSNQKWIKKEIYLIELQYGELDLLLLMTDLLGGGVVLLLALLGATPQPEDQVEGRLLLNVIVG
jgi:hypothetical protein